MININDDEFNYLVNYLKSNFGINLSKKRMLLEGRLASYMTANNLKNYTEYIKLLQTDTTGSEITNLLNKVTTNHTFFMREAEHFRFLQTKLLPLLEKNIPGNDLRIWCAASSTGEEPYTLAMVLQDYFGGKVPKWDKKLLATDISTNVLAKAKTGIYTSEAIAELPTTWKQHYFTRIDSEKYQVSDNIRNEVVFKKFNLMDNIAYRKPYHVIFCRNVMIYFDTPTKDALVDRFYDAMAPGGCLFVGFTESISKNSKFKRVQPSIYQKII